MGGNSAPQRSVIFCIPDDDALLLCLQLQHSTMTSVFSGADDEIYVLIFGLFSDVTRPTMDVFFLSTLHSALGVLLKGFHFKISSGCTKRVLEHTLHFETKKYTSYFLSISVSIPFFFVSPYLFICLETNCFESLHWRSLPPKFYLFLPVKG